MASTRTTDKDKPVTVGECRRHHAMLFKVVVVASTIVSASFVGALTIGWSAQHNIETHAARQNGTQETINSRLGRIEKTQDELHKTTKQILLKLPAN